MTLFAECLSSSWLVWNQLEVPLEVAHGWRRVAAASWTGNFDDSWEVFAKMDLAWWSLRVGEDVLRFVRRAGERPVAQCSVL
jgi:hypothetical protein